MIEFVRQYAGPQLPQGQKSVSYHLKVGALDHTMTAEELTAIRQRIIKACKPSATNSAASTKKTSENFRQPDLAPLRVFF